MNEPHVTGGKACRIHEFGGPEVIRFEAQDSLRPGDGEVLVRVQAATSRVPAAQVGKFLPAPCAYALTG